MLDYHHAVAIAAPSPRQVDRLALSILHAGDEVYG